MPGLLVHCDNCSRSWNLAVTESPYLVADLETHLCPFCESCALRVHIVDSTGLQNQENAAPRLPRRRRAPPDVSRKPKAPTVRRKRR